MLDLGAVRSSSTVSEDGTVIAYHSVGAGPGCVVVGGVLSDGSNYLHLAEALAEQYTVHVMERRGRPGSGPQRPEHSIEDECADLIAVATATDSRSAFGHSLGGLVVLETARRQPIFDELFVYEPGCRCADGSQPVGSMAINVCWIVTSAAARSPGWSSKRGSHLGR